MLENRADYAQASSNHKGTLLLLRALTVHSQIVDKVKGEQQKDYYKGLFM